MTVTEKDLTNTNISTRYELSPVRNFIGDLSGLLASFTDELIGAFFPRTISKKANIVITELVNNAVRNTADENSKIVLETGINRKLLVIRVTNVAGPEQYAAVWNRIERISTSEDPRKLLAQTIRERRKERLRGGLGLIRLAAENKFDLSAAYDAPYLTVESRIALGGLL